MFQIGDYVFHRRCGICVIKAISSLSGNEGEPLYYVLAPLYGEDKGNVVRVPVESALSLRLPIPKKEAYALIAAWPENSKDVYIVDSKKRKQSYEAALAQGDINLLAPLVCGAKQRKARDGHLNSMDSQFVSRAEPLILGELSVSLKMAYEEVADFILSNAGKQLSEEC